MSDPVTANVEASTDAGIDAPHHGVSTNRELRWGSYLVGLSGLGFVGNGFAMLYRVFFSSGFEAGVRALGGVSRAELASTNHELLHYVDHLHVNAAGLMVAAGIALVALAWFGIRRGHRWAWATAIAVPAVFLAHSLPVHQTARFSFDAASHLGPGALWLPALVVGAVLSHRGLGSIDDRSEPAEGGDR